MKRSLHSNTAVALTGLLLLASGCRPAAPRGYQGYLEGEFVHIASPLSGQLESLAAAKGSRVAAGSPLFALERTAEIATQKEAINRLHAAEARLEDLRKGSRPTELATIEARLLQAQAAAELSKRELERQEALFSSRSISANDLDRFRLTHDRNVAAMQEAMSMLATANLGSRSDLIAAAEAEVAALRSAKERADWAVDQKSRSAPRSALVYDTLYREGEFVAAGSPIVSLLPPDSLKARFFVPEHEFAAIRAGQSVVVTVPGKKIDAKVSYLSPKPEYTPPILYNRDNRSKLVFLVEAVVEPAVAVDLHPGQPVDVELKR